MEPLNDSHITLIPRKQGATEVKDFRPISLLNFMQKIFSKLLANRLQPIIHQLITSTQTGFMKRRNINEGFIYAQEVVAMTSRQKEKNMFVQNRHFLKHLTHFHGKIYNKCSRKKDPQTDGLGGS
jgi:predicted site-specific integrase-resolvase